MLLINAHSAHCSMTMPGQKPSPIILSMMLPVATPSCEHVTLYPQRPHTELMLSPTHLQTLDDVGRRTIETFLLGVRPQTGA